MIRLVMTFLLLMFLVWLIAFFAGSETAYLSMTNIRVRQMLRERKKGAKKVASLRNDMDGLLTVVLIGINLINTLAASIATALAVELAGNSGLGIATALITFFVTVFGEIVPKTLAVHDPEKIAVHHANAFIVLQKIFFPIVWIFSKISKGTAFIVEHLWKNNDDLITEEELRTLIEVGESDGALEQNDRAMLSNLIEVSDLHVKNIMKHRSFVTRIHADCTRDEVLKIFTTSGYSHIPVYNDTDDNVIGVLYYKSVLFTPPSADFSVKKIMKEPLFVPETMDFSELLQAFKNDNRTFAVALNEQGVTSGIITLDDVLRSLFGRMSVQHFHHDVNPEQRVKIISSNVFEVPGDMLLADVNSILHMSLTSDESNTLGGWLMEKFGAVPSIGEVLKFDEALFVVQDQSMRRIKNVRIHLGQK